MLYPVRCGHCKSLAPEWAKAATQLKGKFRLGALDATVHTVAASRFSIQGFPTIKYFPGGKKDFSSAVEYDGGRTAGDIVQWASDKWTVNLPPPEIYQVLVDPMIVIVPEVSRLERSLFQYIIMHFWDTKKSMKICFLGSPH